MLMMTAKWELFYQWKSTSGSMKLMITLLIICALLRVICPVSAAAFWGDGNSGIGAIFHTGLLAGCLLVGGTCLLNVTLTNPRKFVSDLITKQHYAPLARMVTRSYAMVLIIRMVINMLMVLAGGALAIVMLNQLSRFYGLYSIITTLPMPLGFWDFVFVMGLVLPVLNVFYWIFSFTIARINFNAYEMTKGQKRRHIGLMVISIPWWILIGIPILLFQRLKNKKTIKNKHRYPVYRESYAKINIMVNAWVGFGHIFGLILVLAGMVVTFGVMIVGNSPLIARIVLLGLSIILLAFSAYQYDKYEIDILMV